MGTRRGAELECPRCRVDPTEADGRQVRCFRCGAELVSAHGPTEDGVRAYLYERHDTRGAPPPVAVEP